MLWTAGEPSISDLTVFCMVGGLVGMTGVGYQRA